MIFGARWGLSFLLGLWLLPFLGISGFAADPVPVDMDYGNAQVAKMLADRPTMAQFTVASGSIHQLTPDDAIWQWAARAYGTKIDGLPVEWNKASPAVNITSLSNFTGPWQGKDGCIRVRDQWSVKGVVRKATFDEEWQACIFELINIQNTDTNKDIFSQCMEGKLSKEDYVRATTKFEFGTYLHLEDFLKETWAPWCGKSGHPYAVICWATDIPKTYEAWIAEQNPKYPQNYRNWYDRVVEPYLKAKHLVPSITSPAGIPAKSAVN